MSSQDDKAFDAPETRKRVRDEQGDHGEYGEHGEFSEMEKTQPGSKSRELAKDSRLLVPSSLELGEAPSASLVVQLAISPEFMSDWAV
jgi:hypothetical protein